MSQKHAQQEQTPATAEERRRPAGVAPQAAAGSGVSSNTPPSNHQSDSSGLTAGGEDWLELSLYVGHGDFENLSQRLDKARDAAEAKEAGDELTIGVQRFLVAAGAARAGGGQKKIAYRWRLQSDSGWTLLLMKRPAPHKTLPNAIARVTSTALMQYGLAGFRQQLQQALAHLKIAIVRNKVSRVDACVDLPNVDVDSFCEPFRQGHYLTRGRNNVLHECDEIFLQGVQEFRVGRQHSGFSLGSGAICLRVYDKMREAMFSPEKLALLAARRWGRSVVCATRVEFQLRRKALKRWGVDSLDDWIAKRGAITQKLTHDWFRLTQTLPDPKHTDRSETLPIWKTSQQRFAEWCGEPCEEPLKPLPVAPANVDHLIKQCVGLLLTILVRLGRPIDSADSFVHEGMCLLIDSIAERDIANDFRRRALLLGVPISAVLRGVPTDEE